MSRFSSSGSQDHGIESLGDKSYIISWSVDRYVKGSRLRFPTRYRRVTDLAGATRFAKRHNIKLPEEVGRG